MFALMDSLPAAVRGYTVPSGKYLNHYVLFLNQLLLLSSNKEEFSKHIKAAPGLVVTSEEAEGAGSNAYERAISSSR